MGTCRVGTDILHWPLENLSFLEYSNTVSSGPNVVDVQHYFNRKEVGWPRGDELLISDDLMSNDQIVFNYLKRLDEGDINQMELTFPTRSNPSKSNVVQISSQECNRLLQTYFFRGFSYADIPSLNVLMVFVNVLGCQLREFSKSGFFLIDSLKFSDSDPRNRERVISNLVTCAREFAVMSSGHVRNRQRREVKDGRGSVDDEYHGLVRWEDND